MGKNTLSARPVPSIPAGNANMETPIIIHMDDKNLPVGVMGVISPYLGNKTNEWGLI